MNFRKTVEIIGFTLMYIGAAILSLVILGGILAILGILSLILKLPAILGRKTADTRFSERAIDKYIGRELLLTLRSDLIEVFYPILAEKDVSTLDRWGLEKQAEEARLRARDKLIRGELILTFIGGVATVILGAFISFTLALAVFLIFLSIMVGLRVTAVDILSFNPANHRHVPLREVLLIRGWNRGPMRGRGAFMILFLAFLLVVTVAKPGSPPYNIGMAMVSDFSCNRVGISVDKWDASETDIFTKYLEMI